MKKVALSILIAMLSISCNKKQADLDEPLFKAPSFTLTDSDGKPFSSDALKGKPWIATLFFTTCNGPCPMMSMRLMEIQEAVNLPDLKIVSISVDPEHDTPDSLKKYAERYKADTSRWIFLTGSMTDIKATIDSFKLVYEPALKDTPIQHDTRFLLIDRDGNVRGIYHHDDDESLAKLKIDSVTLAKK